MVSVEVQARRSGLKRCSSIVDECNFGTIRLCQRLGYEIRNNGQPQRGRIKMQNRYHRMVRELM